MDDARADRIENKLDDLLRVSVPRDELDRRLDKLEDKVDDGLRALTAVETRLEAYDGLNELDFEQLRAAATLASQTRHRESSRQWFWPTIANGFGILISTAIAVVSFVVTGGHHG